MEKTVTEGTKPTREIIRKEETMWIWNDNQGEMIEKTITFVPVLYQLFDAILLSAADYDKWVKDIIVNINVEDNSISVWTHGGCSNDINISLLSQAQPLAHVSFTSGNGEEVPTDEVLNCFGGDLEKVNICENWGFVSLKPHLAYFGMECLEHDLVSLMKRRVVDLAGCSSGVNVQLAGTRVLPRAFPDYVELYIQASREDPTRIYEKLNDRWEIFVATAELAFVGFDEVMFVNNIPMPVEGYIIMSQITDYLGTIFRLEPNVLEYYLWVFVNARTNNPNEIEEDIKQDCQLTPEFLEKIADLLKDYDSLQDYIEYEM